MNPPMDMGGFPETGIPLRVNAQGRADRVEFAQVTVGSLRAPVTFWSGANAIQIAASGSALLFYGSSGSSGLALTPSAGLQLDNANGVKWSNTVNSPTATVDVAMFRNTAGVAEVTDGSSGSNWRDLKLRNLLAGGGNGSYVQTPSMTVANLPAAATAGQGARAFVSDATATTYLSTVAGGGANKVPVVSDGTNWLIG